MTFGKPHPLAYLVVAAAVLLASPARGQSPVGPQPSNEMPLAPGPAEPGLESGPAAPPQTDALGVQPPAASVEPYKSPFAQDGLPGSGQAHETWLRRPFSVGWFAGMVQGTPLIDDWIGMNRGFYGGYRLGWDHDPHWGAETRFAFGAVDLYDSQQAIAAEAIADTLKGIPADSPWRHRFDVCRDANLFQWDVDLVFYPCGDTLLRPYVMIGLGLTTVSFMDRLSEHNHVAALSVPMGAGVKYLWTDRIALRLDLINDTAFGGKGIMGMNNSALTGGVEIRLGGTQRAYWPWNPSRNYW